MLLVNFCAKVIAKMYPEPFVEFGLFLHLFSELDTFKRRAAEVPN